MRICIALTEHSSHVSSQVPQIFTLAADAGLAITGFSDPSLYSPQRISDPSLREMVSGLAWPEQAAFVEDYSGN